MALTTLLVSAFVGLARGLGATDTITWGGDNSRTGYQANHNMDPAIVGSSQFDQLFKTALPGSYVDSAEQIFSQPLVYTPSGSDTQFVYFATTQNNVYKLDAQTGEIVLSRNLHIPFLTADLDGCVDINPTIGITATGVIDPDTDTLYLTSKTYLDQDAGDTAQGKDAGRYYVHALDVNDLTERDNFPVDLQGLIATNNPERMFTGGIHHQRPALLHTGQYVYAGFASHCVQYNFTGWIIGWDKTTGSIVEQFATEGDGVDNTIKGGGVWMSGGGISSDDAGSIFFGTGNGYASQLSTVPVNGFNPPTALEEAAVHMTVNDDGSLDVVDFFMPQEKQALDGADKDLGTSPLEILPSEFSCGEIERIGVITGKSGKTYWLNLDNLGGYRTGEDSGDSVIQVYQNENSVYAGAGVYPLEGGYIYINVIQHPSHVFKFSCDNGSPSFTKVADTPVDNAYILGVSHGTVTSLDGQEGTGLFWITDVQGTQLRIYDAVPKDGTMNLVNSFSIEGVTKFTRPVFGNGVVYVGTTKGSVYGFGAPTNPPLNCSSPVDFGTVDVSDATSKKTITCKALIAVTVSGIGLDEAEDFSITGDSTTPIDLEEGDTISVTAVFDPSSVGLVTDDLIFNTTNSVEGYSISTSARLTGTGSSAEPLLSLIPKSIEFSGIIAGDDNGIVESAILGNNGDSKLTVTSVQYSTDNSTGVYTAWDGEGDLVVGKFTVTNVPASIAANTDNTLSVTFDSSADGTFYGYVKFTTDGGDATLSITGTSGPAPVALLQFQTPDADDWVDYVSGTPFTFGNVTENNALSLKFRVTNNVADDGVNLYLTVSKPPFGVDSIVRAANQVDLAEGTSIDPGDSDSATLTCNVPKSQWNVDPYNGTANWTMNTNDPTFEKQFIEFFCEAVAEQAPPLLENGQGQYRYIGCFRENNPGRQLDTQLFGDDDLTNAECIAACADDDYIFCGTQYHRECWAGNTIPKEKVDDGNCNFYCSGAVNQVCGGNGEGENEGDTFISLFADSLQWDGNYTRPDDGSGDDGDGDGDGDGGAGDDGAGNPVVNPGVDGYVSLGCYTEATTGRALPNGQTLEKKTVANCIEACADESYAFAGLEYAGECWCGDALGTGSVQASDDDCSLVCSGNATEYCGGYSRLNIYELDDSAKNVSTSTSTSSGSMRTSSVILSTSVSVPANFSFPSSTKETTISSSAATTTAKASSTLTSSTASATPTGPAIKKKISNWSFQGCWTETTDGRALSADTLADDDMTLEMCASFCEPHALFGVEYGRECYCGDDLRSGSVEADDPDTCSFLCPGDASEYCGGSMRLELYKFAADSTTSSANEVAQTSKASSVAVAESVSSSKTLASVKSSTSTSVRSSTSTSVRSSTSTSVKSSVSTTASSSRGVTKTTTTTSASATPTVPTVYHGNSNFTYYSCVSEPSSGRLLKSQIFNDGDDMTIEACLERCYMYNYAGVEYGRECWCGNTLNLSGNSGATPGKNVTDIQCSFLCPGDDMTYCGAGVRMSLYTKKDGK